MKQLQFADNVTMTDLNPHNFALKNDYISNLVSTALMVIPIANAIVGSDSVMVKRGFLSRSYIQDELLHKPVFNKADLYKHAEGLGVSITWRDFDSDTAIRVCNEVIFAHPEEKIKMVIEDSTVTFTLDNEKTEIGEVTSTGYRIIRTY